MRKLIGISSAFILIFVVMVQPAFAGSSGEKEVLAAMEGLKEAMLKKDRAALDKILHPDLTYSHSSAKVENKAEAVAHMVDGLGWDAIELADTTVRLQGNVAIVNGKADFHERKKGQPTTVAKLLILTVWVKGPHGWQLIARQAVRRPDDAQVMAAQAALAGATAAEPATAAQSKAGAAAKTP
jgi:ketosteroid isomerase-like protein